MNQNETPTFEKVVAGTSTFTGLKALLYKPVNKAWISKHPYIKDNKGNKIDYVSIGQTETNLDLIFGDHEVEVIETKVYDDCCTATVRIHVPYPDGRKVTQDGAAIVNFKQDKKSQAEEECLNGLLNQSAATKDLVEKAKLIKIYYDLVKAKPIQRGSRETALQVAISAAIKDAADHFGTIFGRDLNRKDDFSSVGGGDDIEATPNKPTQAANQIPDFSFG